LFFDTSEATILLRTKDRYCKKGQKQTDLQAQISPKMHPKNAIFANSGPNLTAKGQVSEGLHGVSNLFWPLGMTLQILRSAQNDTPDSLISLYDRSRKTGPGGRNETQLLSP
jgi:hypothetical protein